jgi:peptidoglycan/xylan/chitin deacetylase (PgdA/CDA1 family)
MSSLVLTYHSIDDSGSVISVSPDRFRRQMAALKRSGAVVTTPDQASRTTGAVAITFDDAFANFHRHALPVLVEHGFPATVFAVSGYCGRRNDWPTQPAGDIPVLDLMSWEQLKECHRAGISIGAHTVTHPFLGALSASAAEQEMLQSREEIEQRLGAATPWFAYPYGDLGGSAREIARRSFQKSFTTELRNLAGASDRAALPRIDVYYIQHPFWFGRLTRPETTAWLASRRLPRKVRQLLYSRPTSSCRKPLQNQVAPDYPKQARRSL